MLFEILTKKIFENLGVFHTRRGLGLSLAILGALLCSLAALGPSPAYGQERLADEGALQELERLAEEGDTEARYRLAKAYAEGKGAEKSDLKAIMWFNCAAQNADPEQVVSAGGRDQAEIEARAGQVVAVLGWLLAELHCDPQGSWTTPYGPNRENIPEKVLLLPGDLTIVASLNLSHHLGLSRLEKLILAAYADMGNLLVAALSVLVWILIVKAIIVFSNASYLKASYGSSLSWMRTPTKSEESHGTRGKSTKDKKETAKTAKAKE